MAYASTEHYRRMFVEFLDQEESASVEPNGVIIAGTGLQELSFQVPKSALETSPVIKGWIEQQNIPASMRKDDALYFPWCDPEVVGATIGYLKSRADGLVAVLDSSAAGGAGRDVLFYVKMYKFALCLGLDELVDGSLHKIKGLTRDTKTFISVLNVATDEKTGLVENSQFTNWMMGYMTQRSEVLKESTVFKSAVMGNSEMAWKLCSLLMSSLGGTGSPNRAQSTPISRSPQLQTPPAATSAKTTPKIERRPSPYSIKPQQKSPTPRQDANRVKKPQKAGAKRFSAYVEEAEDED